MDQEALGALQAASGLEEHLPALSLSVRVSQSVRLAAVLPQGYPEVAPVVRLGAGPCWHGFRARSKDFGPKRRWFSGGSSRRTRGRAIRWAWV